MTTLIRPVRALGLILVLSAVAAPAISGAPAGDSAPPPGAIAAAPDADAPNGWCWYIDDYNHLAYFSDLMDKGSVLRISATRGKAAIREPDVSRAFAQFLKSNYALSYLDTTTRYCDVFEKRILESEKKIRQDMMSNYILQNYKIVNTGWPGR